MKLPTICQLKCFGSFEKLQLNANSIGRRTPSKRQGFLKARVELLPPNDILITRLPVIIFAFPSIRLIIYQRVQGSR